jgi:dTDP-4-dehydrorhamnose 3,5-epimerase-like enzyme
VNAHWSPDAKYASVNLFDPALKIEWPIAKDQAIVSEKDHNNPMLNDVQPMEFDNG